MTVTMILLIDNYDSFTFNLYQYIEELGFRCRVVRNDEIDLEGVRRLAPKRIVISPGPGTPDESGVSLEILRAVENGALPPIPVLGVCLGHQAIGQVFGGKVVRAAKLMHGKVSEIRHDGKGVFKGLKSPLTATRYHSLVIAPRSLPRSLVVTARTADGVIMGVRHRKLPIEGVQFHPESVMTEGGKEMLGNFLRGAAPAKAGARKKAAPRRKGGTR